VKKLKTLRDIQALSKINEKNIKIQACELDEPVCQNNGDETEGTFCFFYDIVFIKLGLRLPLDLFKKEILSIMNIVTAQLHLNSSTIVRAFSILYTHFSLIPMSNMFFFFFFEFKLSSHQLCASLNNVTRRGHISLSRSNLSLTNLVCYKDFLFTGPKTLTFKLLGSWRAICYQA